MEHTINDKSVDLFWCNMLHLIGSKVLSNNIPESIEENDDMAKIFWGYWILTLLSSNNIDESTDSLEIV